MVYRKYKALKQWGKVNTLLFKQMLTARNKRSAPLFEVPEALVEKGIEVHDPNDRNFLKPKEDFQVNHPAFREPTIKDHPLYKNQRAFLFEGNNPFSDGVDQACALIGATKPKSFTEELLKDKMTFPEDLEERVKDGIMCGERYDPTLVRLEKWHDPIIFWTIGQRFYGTPVEKRSQIILEQFYRQILLLSPKGHFSEDNVADYNQSISAYLPADLFGAAMPAVFRLIAPTLIQRSVPVPLVATIDQVEASKTEIVPDIYPISPLIDLTKGKIYNDTTVVPRGILDLHLDTVFLTQPLRQKYPWTTEQNAANAITSAFMLALAQAHRHGQTDKLAKPIVAKAVQLDRGNVDLAVVQLNNLDLNDTEGVKNMVWLEKALPLYKPVKHIENLEKLDNVNVETFKKMANLLLY
ncbi:unnamed protein product [Bursaphelenchus okinawaensis]|uniref:Large ribosomal subunit protein mL37 n=1 Tax=Bursaphelenchus okinawaensis TaxID=465554 RepID=A0A811LKG7_9BILA|nr:unnamed protein product [Bursaphelenchus okinawaensis]CAG9127503.1 unnamed protein product [Bursaphelenchus okinawaensis]